MGLADEAFLRRIRYKVEIPDPTPEEFRTIFARVCAEQGIEFRGEAVDYLLAQWYKLYERALRDCHPRDLVEAIVDLARYGESGSAMVTRESLDEVCHTLWDANIPSVSG